MNGSHPFPALPSELSIYTAGETASLWRAWLAAANANLAEAPAIDASAVDVVDGAGIQLLLSLARQLTERGLGLQLAAPSSVLAEACDALGASALLASRAAA
jgi:anti-anti-sigma regulatory factor